jgi:hypothetical protein
MFIEEDGVFALCNIGFVLSCFRRTSYAVFFEEPANVTFRGTHHPRLLENNNSTTTF